VHSIQLSTSAAADLTRSNPKFWEMIEEVRKEPTLTLEEAKKRFQDADDFEAKHGRPMTPAAAKKLVRGKGKAASAGRATAPRRKRGSL
jgi:hypothetical protein